MRHPEPGKWMLYSMMDLCIIRTPGEDVSPGPLPQPHHVLDTVEVQQVYQRLAQLLHARVPALLSRDQLPANHSSPRHVRGPHLLARQHHVEEHRPAFTLLSKYKYVVNLYLDAMLAMAGRDANLRILQLLLPRSCTVRNTALALDSSFLYVFSSPVFRPCIPTRMPKQSSSTSGPHLDHLGDGGSPLTIFKIIADTLISIPMSNHLRRTPAV